MRSWPISDDEDDSAASDTQTKLRKKYGHQRRIQLYCPTKHTPIHPDDAYIWYDDSDDRPSRNRSNYRSHCGCCNLPALIKCNRIDCSGYGELHRSNKHGGGEPRLEDEDHTGDDDDGDGGDGGDEGALTEESAWHDGHSQE